MRQQKHGPMLLMGEIFLVGPYHLNNPTVNIFVIRKWGLHLRAGGSKPNLADLAVFGVLRPIRYLKAGVDMVENTRIGDWYQRMEIAVGESSKLPAQN